jgi:hypothetical protein
MKVDMKKDMKGGLFGKMKEINMMGDRDDNGGRNIIITCMKMS